MREPVERRLAAILAADVAGYSRLMGADEEGTHERLKAHRRELVDPKIREHHGRIVKTTGDGMLVEFAERRRRGALRRRDAAGDGRPQRRDARGPAHQLPHRDQSRRRDRRRRRHLRRRRQHRGAAGGIGGAGRHLHLAARCATRSATSSPTPFEDMGEQSVKNIARPVRVYAMSAAAVASTAARRDAGAAWSAAPPHQPAAAPSSRRASLPRSASGSRPGGLGPSEIRRRYRPRRLQRRARKARLPSRAPIGAAPVDRRPALRQSVERSGPGIFRRRDHRRSDDRSLADLRTAS